MRHTHARTVVLALAMQLLYTAMAASGGGLGGGLGAEGFTRAGRFGEGGGRAGLAHLARRMLPTNQNKSVPMMNIMQW
jgi:hypothetical protein